MFSLSSLSLFTRCASGSKLAVASFHSSWRHYSEPYHPLKGEALKTPTTTQRYAITDHTFDALVIGTGGAGLRAAVGLAEKGFQTASISKALPASSGTAISDEGINATPEGDEPHWHEFDTIMNGRYLADEAAVEHMCLQAPNTISEMEHYGMKFPRTPDGKIIQQVNSRQFINYGKGRLASRTCPVPTGGTGMAIVQALYSQALLHRNCKFFMEYFVMDLIMEEGECRGVIAICLEDGSVHRFRAHQTILCTGGYARTWRSHACTKGTTGDGNAMVSRAGLPCKDLEFVDFCPITLSRYGYSIPGQVFSEGCILVNNEEERFMERYSPMAMELAGGEFLSKAIETEIEQGRGVGENKDHIYLQLHHLGAAVLHERLPGILAAVRTFTGIEATKDPIPVSVSANFTLGGIPTNMNGEVLSSVDGTTVKGLMAAGEAACVSVHGASLLNGNSLLEALTFGRACADRVTQILPNDTPHRPLLAGAGEMSISNMDGLVNSKGDIEVPELRRAMQQVMQDHAWVFRNDAGMSKGIEALRAIHADLPRLKVARKDQASNECLIEALQLQNMMSQATQTLTSAHGRKGSYGTHGRDDSPDHRSLAWTDLRRTFSWYHCGEVKLDRELAQRSKYSRSNPQIHPF